MLHFVTHSTPDSHAGPATLANAPQIVSEHVLSPLGPPCLLRQLLCRCQGVVGGSGATRAQHKRPGSGGAALCRPHKPTPRGYNTGACPYAVSAATPWGIGVHSADVRTRSPAPACHAARAAAATTRSDQLAVAHGTAADTLALAEQLMSRSASWAAWNSGEQCMVDLTCVNGDARVRVVQQRLGVELVWDKRGSVCVKDSIGGRDVTSSVMAHTTLAASALCSSSHLSSPLIGHVVDAAEWWARAMTNRHGVPASTSLACRNQQHLTRLLTRCQASPEPTPATS